MCDTCYLHYYCSCERISRLCHYCRKKDTFFRQHYICTHCHIGFKTIHGKQLKQDAQGAQLVEIILEENFKGKRCPICAKDGTPVSYDFRIPKRKNLKEWNKIKNDIKDIGVHEFIKKYTYECGGSYFIQKEILYKQRLKAPWTVNKWNKNRDPPARGSTTNNKLF